MIGNQTDIDKVFKTALSSASVEEMEAARTRIFDGLRSDNGRAVLHPLVEIIPNSMASERESASTTAKDGRTTFTRFPLKWRFAMGVAAALAVILSLPFIRALIVPDNVYAIVETVDGSLYRFADGKTLTVNVGERISAGTPVHTDGGTGAVLKLSDGARIEMHADSELLLEHANDGTRIRLSIGSVSVTPSEQPAGNLYVQNREVTVPVVGTTFATVQPRPEFEIADVHASLPRGDGRSVLLMEGSGVVRGGRYEIYNATMMDLIRTAYNVEADTVLGGPSWLALDRFDVIAKPPEGKTTASSINLMLQSLLADRFKLGVRKDRMPRPAWVLSKGPGETRLKPADSSGESACRVAENNDRLSCRNVTMDAFLARLHEDPRTRLPFVNSSGIEGSWDFDVNYNIIGGQVLITENNLILAAIEKQLGLKLELKNIPQPVLIVESVNRNPTLNAADIQKLLPPDPVDFDVASVRSCQAVDPRSVNGDLGQRSSPSGLVTTGCFSLLTHVVTAWNLCPSGPGGPGCRPDDVVAGGPGWLKSRYFNIVAKAPIPMGNLNVDVNYRTMLRNLLVDRFKMVTHYEDRLMDVYTLVAAKPKLRKADTSSRAECKSNSGGFGVPTVMTCMNVTMAQFAEEISRFGGANPSWRPILDASDIPGTWDLTLTFGGRAAGARAATADGVASTPAGGIPIPEAIEQQLGLKLEAAKRRMPVFVIDHIVENPTEN